jgi:hypothetical protein
MPTQIIDLLMAAFKHCILHDQFDGFVLLQCFLGLMSAISKYIIFNYINDA